MASRAGPAHMDLPPDGAGRSPRYPHRGGRTAPAAGAGERQVGPSTHPGRAGQTRPRRQRPGRARRSPAAPRPARSTAPTGENLARLHPVAPGSAAGLRFLHRRDALPQSDPCLVLRRTRHAPGASRRMHGPPDRRLGHAAGAPARPDDAGDGHVAPVPHPRSQRDVPPTCDTAFASAGVALVRTPYRAPDANADAARRVRSARAACLDHRLVVGEAHMRRVPTEYVACDNEVQPHQGLEQRRPVALPPPRRDGPVRVRDQLGGPLHDDDREVACAVMLLRMPFPHATRTIYATIEERCIR